MPDKTNTQVDLPPDLPLGAELDADGLWSQVLNLVQGTGRRPALFLDRDGVVVEDVHYLGHPDDVHLIDGAVRIIAEANKLAIPVIIATNQAGISRGHFGWPEFIAVQEKIHDGLADEGVFINGVFACPHHGDGRAPYDTPDHPWRKPNPGMLLAAAQRLPIVLEKSLIIGDKAADLEAGKKAGLAGGIHVLTGHGKDGGEREASLGLSGDGYQVLTADNIGDAGALLGFFQGNGVIDGAS
ncbi:MAG: HAD family hydrolase [Rhodospirillales bacterium]|nr:HAD family hydrolase [Rhodospirillales bacterium]